MGIVEEWDEICIKYMTFIQKRTKKSLSHARSFMYFVEIFEFGCLMMDEGMVRWYDFSMIISP